jgi:hypothetical protein
MALENQRVEEADAQYELERLARALIEKSGSNLWE